MNKAKDWNGKDLKGVWDITYKIDGVRALSDGHKVTSRNGKPLYGCDHLASSFQDAEIYCGDFKSTIETVRTQHGTHVHPSCVFALHPVIDERLIIEECVPNPTAKQIEGWLRHATSLKYEGIVLRNPTTGEWIKHKPVRTYDVTVTGYTEGKGKFAGMLGKLHSDMGDVGTGFSDYERKVLWDGRDGLVGMTVEVECMELTPGGKFRFPRYVRMRFDK